MIAAVGLGLLWPGAGCVREDRADADPTTTTVAATDTGRAGPAATGPPSGAVRPVVGPVATPVAVGPPDGHPRQRIDRDAGITARLRDGSTVWFFGDTAEREPDDSLAYFEIGSAAWAAPGEPTVTRDPPGPVAPFAVPTADFPACPPEATTAGLWPLATAVVPDGERDRVLVWMQNICLGPNRAAVDRGISIGEWTYDPADPPDGRPVEVAVLEQNLFPDARYGDAVVEHDGRLYVYGCDAPLQPAWPTESGPCRVARVRADDATDADRYEAWTGEGWEAGADPAPLGLLSDEGDPAAPPGPLSVSFHDGTGVFVMLYTPWPGYIGTVAVRAAPAPEGPWSTPTTVELPDCGGTYRGQEMACYAANLQPVSDTADRIGLGYYDRLVSQPPLRGSYVLTSAPFAVEATAG